MSYMMTVSAACKFSPTPPALTLSRNTDTAEPATDAGLGAAYRSAHELILPGLEVVWPAQLLPHDKIQYVSKPCLE